MLFIIISYYHYFLLFIATYSTNSYSNTGPVKVVDIPSPEAGATYNVVVKVVNSLAVSPQSYAIVITGQLTGLNATNDDTVNGEIQSDVVLSAESINLIICLSIAAAVLSLAIASIYMNDRHTRKLLEQDLQRRSTIARSRSNSRASSQGRHQPVRSHSAPGSRRPSGQRRRSSNMSSSPNRSQNNSGANSPALPNGNVRRFSGDHEWPPNGQPMVNTSQWIE
jgi:hypothetical protein